jgi:hypothetical protein
MTDDKTNREKDPWPWQPQPPEETTEKYSISCPQNKWGSMERLRPKS